MAVSTQIRCPACQGALFPAELRCDACDLSVRGRFAVNEFASLGEDDLHFLRIFVLCEGRIRDMESALGVSYPSIKGRMARLKDALALAAGAARTAAPAKTPAAPMGASETVLKELESGRITFEEATARLKIQRKEADL